jgi:hypothetical protein
MKKSVLALFGIILLTSFIAAKSINIEFPNGNSFQAGEPITFKATLYDDSNNPIDGVIKITIEDSEKKTTIEKTVQSKEISTIDLGVTASSGQGVITAEANGIQTIEFFSIGSNELVRFELDGSTLKVTNTGNTPYTKTIKITIGDTTGTQQPQLDIGKSVSYRLIAPDGTYDIKITDGKNSLIKSGIALTGTGNAIGAIDESVSSRSPVTGVTSPDAQSDVAILSYIQRNKFVYIFIGVVFAAAILIGIERRYRKNA